MTATASCNHREAVRVKPAGVFHNHTDVLIALGHKGKGGKYQNSWDLGPDDLATTTRK